MEPTETHEKVNKSAHVTKSNQSKCGQESSTKQSTLKELAKPSGSQRQASPLERLPTEILQHLFLLSANLSLPKASPFLCDVLSSVHIRTELVIQNFSAKLPWDKRLCKNTQNALLNQRWLTYSFFKQCQRICLLRKAKEHLLKFAENTPSEDRLKALEGLECALTRAWTHPYQISPYPLYNETGDVEVLFQWAREDGQTFLAKIIGKRWGDAAQLFVEISNPKNPKDTKSQTLAERDGVIRAAQEWFHMPAFEGLTSFANVPEKLLHGPWTQENGDFLKQLTDTGCIIDVNSPTAMAAATRGLEDAIREESEVAIQALVSFKGHYIEDSRYEELIETLVQEPSPNPGKWLFIKGKEWDSMGGLELEPNRDHVLLALQRPQARKSILQALLSDSDPINISPQDRDIRAWITQRNIADASLPRGEFRLGKWLSVTLRRAHRRKRERELMIAGDERHHRPDDEVSADGPGQRSESVERVVDTQEAVIDRNVMENILTWKRP
jgi:hypothetical protein